MSDFAADRRAATPSQAAELVVADADSYLRYVEELTARGERVLVHQLEQAQHKLQRLQGFMGFSQAGTLAGAIAAAYGYGDAAAAGQDGKYSAETAAQVWTAGSAA